MPIAPTTPYPVLAACIGQDRAPRPEEIERVAHRVLREGLSVRRDAAARNLAVRVARIALFGGRNAD
ncbi:MAG: hypothetical protein JSR79_09125 [Proteobacteria bacterium]|nr:hypothetical protein [Pseudomonadota bacterium]